jgi:hypothetical protein
MTIEIPDHLYKDVEQLIKDKGAKNAPDNSDIDTFITDSGSSEYVEYWGEEITTKRNWKSSPDHPETFLAYITVAEAKMLRSLGLGYSDIDADGNFRQHYDNQGIPSFNGYGAGDSDSGGFGGSDNSEGESEASGGNDSSGDDGDDDSGFGGNGMSRSYASALEKAGLGDIQAEGNTLNDDGSYSLGRTFGDIANSKDAYGNDWSTSPYNKTVITTKNIDQALASSDRYTVSNMSTNGIIEITDNLTGDTVSVRNGTAISGSIDIGGGQSFGVNDGDIMESTADYKAIVADVSDKHKTIAYQDMNGKLISSYSEQYDSSGSITGTSTKQYSDKGTTTFGYDDNNNLSVDFTDLEGNVKSYNMTDDGKFRNALGATYDDFDSVANASIGIEKEEANNMWNSAGKAFLGTLALSGNIGVGLVAGFASMASSYATDFFGDVSSGIKSQINNLTEKYNLGLLDDTGYMNGIKGLSYSDTDDGGNTYYKNIFTDEVISYSDAKDQGLNPDTKSYANKEIFDTFTGIMDHVGFDKNRFQEVFQGKYSKDSKVVKQEFDKVINGKRVELQKQKDVLESARPALQEKYELAQNQKNLFYETFGGQA